MEIKKEPEISVIIPVYNEGGKNAVAFKVTLLSLGHKHQKTIVPYEIIVCDNNSTDNTAEIARQYADVVVSETQQGGVYARNTGTKASKGRYLVHADADTIFPSDFIEKAYAIFRSERFVGWTCGGWDYYDGKIMRVRIIRHHFGLLYHLYARSTARKNTSILLGWCLCTPRAVFDKVKGFTPQMKKFEDVEYSWKIEPLGRKEYFDTINVQSSLRRFENGIIRTQRYYNRRGAGMFVLIKNYFRKSRYHPKK
jgi:glycosyltransferase involved in cell wall biosynthesis